MVTGALVDRFGPRRIQALLLTVFSIPVYLLGTVFNFASFAAARFFIGGLGATFVVTEYWTAIMFSRSLIGTANAVAAGWGNAGGGATNALMPQFYDLMKVFGLDEEKAWRVVMVIPGTMCVTWAALLFFFSDDCPDGDYKRMYRLGTMRQISALEAFARAARNPCTYVLFCLYASSFGVELTMDNVLATYFNTVFNLDQSIAGVAAGLFGLMNLFARAVGGIGSDLIARKYSMRGRVLWLFANLVLEGVFCLVFSRMTTIDAAIPMLILFSLFTQASCGAVFAIVPFVDPIATGSVGGIVGAGGNTGGVTLSLVFSHMSDPDAVRLISFVVLGVSLLTFLLLWPFPVKVTLVGISDSERRAVERMSLQQDDLGISSQALVGKDGALRDVALSTNESDVPRIGQRDSIEPQDAMLETPFAFPLSPNGHEAGDATPKTR
ncbi:Nitrate transporter [Cyanidiococcus yangmingshanensis]|uniref:Nitrate transporter n=1 Tax=Cyanidiococcus yangmingshanensis TaxID=2690220 RepID=A0A7J7IF18_9RHOD|nr:Nitrate transporter [Cyanidiococcus yangmingshanensis]